MAIETPETEIDTVIGVVFVFVKDFPGFFWALFIILLAKSMLLNMKKCVSLGISLILKRKTFYYLSAHITEGSLLSQLSVKFSKKH